MKYNVYLLLNLNKKIRVGIFKMGPWAGVTHYRVYTELRFRLPFDSTFIILYVEVYENLMWFRNFFIL